MSSLVHGLCAALGAAVLYGGAPVAQALAIARQPAGGGVGITLTLRLARRPLWLAGLAADVAGFALEAYAFSAAAATLVAPVMACDMLVFVLLCWPAFGQRPSARGASGAVGMAAAVGLLALAFGAHAHVGSAASKVELIAFGVGSAAVCAAAGPFGTRLMAQSRGVAAAAVFSVASGCCYGLATMATRQVGRTLHVDDPWQIFTTPTPYVLAVCSLLGITMMQRGLQAGPALTFPVTSALAAFVPVTLGAVVLGDRVPSGTGLASFVAALVLLAGGVGLLGVDRSHAEASSAPVSESDAALTSGGAAPTG